MRVGSLFAGIGGFDLAAERAGMTVVWQSQWEPPSWAWHEMYRKRRRHWREQHYGDTRFGRWVPDPQRAAQVLAHHWPNVPNYGDIHGIKSPPTVDVLCGGFPCQSYSVAGSRGGLADDRGALWWEFHRLIDEVRPTWVVGENVPGLLSSRGGADFETIIGSLTELGYGVVWRVLDAQWFGVAQRRRRVFIVGHSGGVPRPEILALGQGVFGDSPPSREKREGVAPTLASRTRGGGWPGSDEAIDGALAFNWQSGGDVRLGLRVEHTDALHSSQTVAVKHQTHVLFDAPRRGDGVRIQGDTTPTLTARMGTGGLNTPMIATSSVRRLTPLECERLQGFPDGWTDIPGNSDTQRYRQLGNAVAVPVAEWIMRRIAVAGMAGAQLLLTTNPTQE